MGGLCAITRNPTGKSVFATPSLVYLTLVLQWTEKTGGNGCTFLKCPSKRSQGTSTSSAYWIPTFISSKGIFSFRFRLYACDCSKTVRGSQWYAAMVTCAKVFLIFHSICM